jgi:hypothetical protein
MKVYVLFYQQSDPMNHAQYNPEAIMVGVYATEKRAQQQMVEECCVDRNSMDSYYIDEQEVIK